MMKHVMLAAMRPTISPPMRAAIAAALIACLAAPTSAHAYVRTRSPSQRVPLAWTNPHITMTLRTSDPQIVPADDFRTAATRAAATWSAPGLASAVAFDVGWSGDAPAGTHFDQINVISFRTDSWAPPMYPESVLALTTVWSRDAQIVDADTEINAVDPTFAWGLLPDDPAVAAMNAGVDLQNALTHELGHVLGLAHPCFLGDGPPAMRSFDDHGAEVPPCSEPALPASVRMATMFPSSAPGSIAERDLSGDEIAAIHDIYPVPAALTPTLGDRSGGCRLAPANDGATGLAALAILGAAMVSRRRRLR
jgi:uncharacterized protein (TIGR03382 family)